MIRGLRRLLDRLVWPFASMLALRKYGGIWGLKEHLARTHAKNKRQLAIYEAYFSKTGSWIGSNARFDGVPYFPHGPFGVFVSNGARIGKNAIIFQHVTIGSNTLSDSDRAGSPRIGDNVYIGAGAKIVGGITIGDNCRIGANAVVYKDMPSNSVAVQSPTRIIQKDMLDNRFYTKKNGKRVYYDNGTWIEDESKRS